MRTDIMLSHPESGAILEIGLMEGMLTLPYILTSFDDHLVSVCSGNPLGLHLLDFVQKVDETPCRICLQHLCCNKNYFVRLKGWSHDKLNYPLTWPRPFLWTALTFSS